MNSMPVPWRPAFPESSLWAAEYTVTLPLIGELPCRTTLMQTPTSGTWVYSPGVGLADSLQNTLGEEPLHLVAPNSFHHLGLSEWSTVYPQATTWVAPDARSRLRKFGQEVQLLEAAKLPKEIIVQVIPESRAGEVWLLICEDAGWVWLVGDAFFHLETAGHWSNRLFDNAPGCKVSRVFWWGSLRNRMAYRQRVETLLEKHRPHALIPCHGTSLTGKAVSEVMYHALSQRR